jgi:hypothetical protein
MGIFVQDAEVGDFNNDGKPDIVAVGGANFVMVALGNGDGTFGAPISSLLPLGPTHLGLIAIGDFNQDGNEDIAVSSAAGNNVAVAFGNGDGTFSGTITLPTAAGQIIVADFNGDGIPDLAVAHPSTYSVGILLGTGGRAFGAPSEYPFAPHLYNMVAADVNNDGAVDLLASVSPTQGDSREIVVLLGNGAGGFSAPINALSFDFLYNPWDSYALRDLNGDGKLDLILAPGYGYQVGVSFGNGDGTFAQPTFFPISNDGQYTGGADGISVVDFNGDGILDVLTERAIVLDGMTQNSLDIYLGQGAGNLQPLGVSSISPGELDGYESLTSLALADVNGDGRIDIVAVSDVGDTFVEILEGSPLPLLQVAVTDSGNFMVGGLGTTFTLTVNNEPGAATTSGPVTVSQAMSSGMSLVSVSGPGWVCSSTACSRSDPLSSGSSYPPITITVDLPTTYSFPQVTQDATVSGGGSSVISESSDSVTLSPATPVQTSPQNGSTGTSVTLSLVWSASPGATSYDVYFGTSNPPPFVVNTTSTTYSPGTLTGNTTYYWYVVAKGPSGAEPSATWSFTTQTPLQFYPFAPCRLVDTRGEAAGFNGIAPFSGPSIASGGTLTIPVQSTTEASTNTTPAPCGTIPSTAQAYSLNITVVPHAAGVVDYVSLWPAGSPKPYVSTLNDTEGLIVANAAIVPAGTPSGGISVYNSGPSATDVVIDMNGYFAPPATGLQFYPVAPCRLVDTRGTAAGFNGMDPFSGPSITTGQTLTILVQSTAEAGDNTEPAPCGVIPSTAQAYSFNVAVVPQGAVDYVTLWPAGSTQPYVSTLDDPEGSILANAAIVPAGTSSGGVSVYNSGPATTDVVIDMNGYFAPPATALQFYPVAPCRLVDTRGAAAGFNGLAPFSGPSISAGGTITIPVQSTSEASANTEPAPCGVIPSTAQAYSFNLTVVPHSSEAVDYVTLWPAGSTKPYVATLNDTEGLIVSNAAIVPAGSPTGGISVYNAGPGATDVIIDMNGYFAP